MSRFLLRRLAIIPIALIVINFFGFAYAHIARPLRAARNPSLIGLTEPTPLLPVYADYVERVVRADFGVIPSSGEALTRVVARAGVASLGLLALAMMLSSLLGILLGILATRTDPPHTARWLTALSTAGLALPTFYLGALFTIGVIYLIMGGAGTDFIPIRGFGWDKHLILPVLTLIPRPTVQIAQVTSGLLVEELKKDYVKASRGFGHRWAYILRHLAMRNAWAQIILTMSGTFRFMIGELIVVEFLFGWPGIGRLLALTLVPARLSSSSSSPLFLDPPVVAAMLTVLAALFLLVDLLASTFIRLIDPRLAVVKEDMAYV